VDLLPVLNSFIHRDVKPANIMIDELYQSRVGDFSSAKSIEGSKQWTGSTWTSQYALPESARMPIIPLLRMLQLTDHQQDRALQVGSSEGNPQQYVGTSVITRAFLTESRSNSSRLEDPLEEFFHWTLIVVSFLHHK
jgi:serine/threonine protein kinase